MQGNQNRLCGLLMRSYCWCNSHSTTMRVSCKKGSQACSPPLLLLLWDVAGFRGWRLEVEWWDDGVIQSMQIRRPHENTGAAFLDFSTLTPGFKKVRLQTLCLQDPWGRSAKTMQNMCVYTHKSFHVDGPWSCRLTVQKMIYGHLQNSRLVWKLGNIHKSTISTDIIKDGSSL